MMRPKAPGAALKRRDLLLLGAGVFAAALVRLPLLGQVSADHPTAYFPWMDFMAAHGSFASLAHDFAVYNPPYLYLLSAAVALARHLPMIVAHKAVSIAFDFAIAYFVYKCVALKYPESKRVPVLAAVAALLAPTVVLNAAWWGQVDSIHTAFLLASVYFVLAGRQAFAFTVFGLAFAVKAQAMFLAPLFLWLAARKVVDLRYSAFAVFAAFAALVPSWAAGRPLTDLLFVYVRQAGYTGELSNQAPNLYEWIPEDYFLWWPLGVAVTAALVLAVRQFVKHGSAALTGGTIVFLALFSTLLAPFFLPKMHDRFFFPADVLAIVFAFYRPRYWYAPAALAVISGSTYPRYVLNTETIPLPVAAFALLLLLLGLFRGLLESLGYRVRLRAAVEWIRRRAKVRRAAAAPLLLLSLAFFALFTAFHLEGRFGRGLENGGASAATLARAANRSPEHGLAAFSRRSLDPEGRMVYETAAGGSVAGDLVLAAVVRHFRDDLGAQVVAARALMVSLFSGAALLAFLSLRRLFASRGAGSGWIALAATLFAFGSAAAGFADTVAVEAAPELFGVFLLFHGMAVFRDEGRFPQLALKCAAALALGWQAAALVFPFAAAGLAASLSRRTNESLPNGGPSAPGGDRRSARAFLRSPYSMLAGGAAALCLLSGPFAGSLPGVSAGAAPPPADLPAGAAADLTEASVGAADFGSFASAEFSRIARSFVPYPLTAASAGSDASESSPGDPDAAALVGVLLTAGCLFGAAWSDRRLLLVPLALAGLGSFVGLPPGAAAGAPGPAEFGALSVVAIPLVAWALVFDAASRRLGPGAPRLAAGLGLASFLLAVPLGARRDPARSGEARQSAAEGREDFGRIRRVLRRRAEETVFLPPVRVGGRILEGDRAAYYLAGSVSVEAPAPRASAEFTIAGEAETASGLLTPGNREVFLYHRAAYDGELDGLIEAAGAPVARSEFEVRLGGGRLLFVKDGCRPEHREGFFIVHLWPEDPDDLPPLRKPYGFENRSFLFADRAYETGNRCVAGIRFPEYPIRSASVGRSFRHPDGSYDRVWREEFTPGLAARPFGGGS